LALAVQSVHCAPPFPHWAGVVPATHESPEQHPLVQLDAPHATHACSAEHVFPEVVQSSHAVPFPQAVLLVPARQTPLASQQPFGQVAPSHGLQALPKQTLSASKMQLTHAAPPVPHLSLAPPAWHFPVPSQQPAGQVLAPHGSQCF
jgi:hypothetical protein